jgi:hypothetical protein
LRNKPFAHKEIALACSKLLAYDAAVDLGLRFGVG